MINGKGHEFRMEDESKLECYRPTLGMTGAGSGMTGGMKKENQLGFVGDIMSKLQLKMVVSGRTFEEQIQKTKTAIEDDR